MRDSDSMCVTWTNAASEPVLRTVSRLNFTDHVSQFHLVDQGKNIVVVVDNYSEAFVSRIDVLTQAVAHNFLVPVGHCVSKIEVFQQCSKYFIIWLKSFARHGLEERSGMVACVSGDAGPFTTLDVRTGTRRTLPNDVRVRAIDHSGVFLWYHATNGYMSVSATLPTTDDADTQPDIITHKSATSLCFSYGVAVLACEEKLCIVRFDSE